MNGEQFLKWYKSTDPIILTPLDTDNKNEEKDAIAEYKQSKLKTCKRCRQELHISNFSVSHNTADGLMTYCKKCMTDVKTNGKLRHKPCVEKIPPKEDPLKEVNYAPFNLIEIPASGWLSYVPDKELYNELLRRGWEGEMNKQLKNDKNETL